MNLRRAAGSCCLLLATAAPAQTGAFAARDAADGVSCRLFDAAIGAPWPGGDTPAWIDASGRERGARAFDMLLLEPRDAPQVLRWNLLTLVQQWGSGRVPNDGLLLVAAGPAGVEVHSREAADIGSRPSLRVVHRDGAVELLSASADAALDCSTHAGLGTRPTMRIGADAPAYLRFDLARLRKGKAAEAKSAELILVRAPGSSPQGGAVMLYRAATPWGPAFEPEAASLAARYPGDRGIERDADVLFADRFDRSGLPPPWNLVQAVRATVVDGPAAGPEARPTGQALRATVPRNEHLGLDLRYDFRVLQKQEPEEVYFRYYLRVRPEWAAAPDSGKLPGLAGTYGRAGWGGRGWDGRQGWSARGAFLKAAPVGHPAANRLVLASYVYHGKAASSYGDTFTWAGADGAAFLEPERWYCIEQHVRLNTPGRDDGVLRAWVDGKPVFQRRDLRLRDVPALRIENVWMDVYMGGGQPAQRDMTLWIDNVVVATRYIGPIVPGP